MGFLADEMTTNYSTSFAFKDPMMKHFFTIERVGKLVTTVPLDREEMSKYDFEIITINIEDPDIINVVPVTVYVIDENDNSPVFTSPSEINSVLMIAQGTVAGTIVTTFEAEDIDGAQNTSLTFYIKNFQSDILKLNAVTGDLILVRDIIAIDVGIYTLVIVASDGGIPPNYGQIYINVVVGTQNSIEREIKLEFHIPENRAAGIHIGLLNIGGANFGLTPPLKFTLFRDEMAADVFSLDSSGLLTATQSLDREEVSEYDMSVLVEDNDFINPDVLLIVKVIVDDENDHKPVFVFPASPNDTLLVPFNSTPNHLVAELDAFDPDADMNGRVTYEIDFGNGDGLFKLDSDTGVLTIARYMKPGERLNHQLFLSARDNGYVPLVAWTKLNIDFNQIAVGGVMTESNMLLTAVLVPTITFMLVCIVIILVKTRRSSRHRCCCSESPEDKLNSKRLAYSAFNTHETVVKQGKRLFVFPNNNEDSSEEDVIKIESPGLYGAGQPSMRLSFSDLGQQSETVLHNAQSEIHI